MTSSQNPVTPRKRFPSDKTPSQKESVGSEPLATSAPQESIKPAKKATDHTRETIQATGRVRAIPNTKNNKKNTSVRQGSSITQDSGKAANKRKPLFFLATVGLILFLGVGSGFFFLQSQGAVSVDSLAASLPFLPITPHAKIVFASESYSFGTISEGEEVQHVFQLHNAGQEVLTIEKTITSCGCTAAVVGKKSIPPGESGEIVVTFNSTGRSGKQDKTIRVFSSDPERSEVVLSLRGEVE